MEGRSNTKQLASLGRISPDTCYPPSTAAPYKKTRAQIVLSCGLFQAPYQCSVIR